MRKKGRKLATLKTVSDRTRLLATHCNILDPEEVKETSANIGWKNSTKNIAISDITSFYFFHGIKWNDKSHYQKRVTTFHINRSRNRPTHSISRKNLPSPLTTPHRSRSENRRSRKPPME
ncbi:MAG: hypothetical protein NWE84_01725 [Candidatus Bathyarchaeota archaeon]|nr:hypothetical protein [Candidatus Bathyarchaeota archaeon]